MSAKNPIPPALAFANHMRAETAAKRRIRKKAHLANKQLVKMAVRFNEASAEKAQLKKDIISQTALVSKLDAICK